MRFLLVFAFIGAVPGVTEAQLFRRRCAPAVKVIQQQVVQQVVPVVPVAFVLAQPSQYGVPQYTPPAPVRQSPQVQQQSQQLDSAVRRLGDLILNLDSRLDALEAKIGASTPTRPVSIPQVVQQQCAMCHTGAEAKAELTLDMLAEPSKNRSAVQMVESGKMPIGQDDMPIQLEVTERTRLVNALKEMVR